MATGVIQKWRLVLMMTSVETVVMLMMTSVEAIEVVVVVGSVMVMVFPKEQVAGSVVVGLVVVGSVVVGLVVVMAAAMEYDTTHLADHLQCILNHLYVRTPHSMHQQTQTFATCSSRSSCPTQ